jgi:hypothetical protein
LNLLQYGNVGILGLPEGKELLILSAGLCSTARESAGTGKAKMRQRSDRHVLHHPAMHQDLLKLLLCRRTLVQKKLQIRPNRRYASATRVTMRMP